jgi:hypothetical protein
MRNLPAVVEDSAADRERLKSILRLAQSSGDRYHVTALRLVLKRFDNARESRAAAGRGRFRRKLSRNPATGGRERAMQTRDPRSVPTNVIPFPRKRPQPGQIALGMTIRGDFVRFSPALRERLARMAAEVGCRHSRGRT